MKTLIKAAASVALLAALAVPASAVAASAQADPPLLPSCRSVTFYGNSGHISVQENNNHALQWGITMTPSFLSVGKWNVDVYLSGKKINNVQKNVLALGYVVHASQLNVPSGKVFSISATVTRNLIIVIQTASSVRNACVTL
jgi:hypothetical protein